MAMAARTIRQSSALHLIRGVIGRWRPLMAGGAIAGVLADQWPPFVKSLLISAATLLMVAAATVLIFVAKDILGTLNLVSVLYLLPVLAAAIRWGTWPAILAATAGALAADFFFYPPLYSFRIEDPQNVADLIIFLVVAVVTGDLTADLRRRERDLQLLYEYSKRLAACFTSADLIQATQDYLSTCLERPALLRATTSLHQADERTNIPAAVLTRAAAISDFKTARSATVVDEASRHSWLVRGVSFAGMDYVALVDLGTRPVGRAARLNRRLDAILTEAAANLNRLDLAQAVEQFRIQAQSESLKNALVATMSHELRNPLVSILGATSVLEKLPGVSGDAQARSLAESVHEQAARLDSDIHNLVDAARLTAGAVSPMLEATDVVDIVRAATEQKRAQLAAHQLELSLPAELPLVQVHASLIENALAQLFDNAAKYSPPGSTITIDATALQDRVVISVSDQGIGLTIDERAQVGRRSFRGASQSAVRGSGLGLWIANTFVAANRGRLEVESAGPDRGTTIRIYLPIASDLDRGSQE